MSLKISPMTISLTIEADLFYDDPRDDYNYNDVDYYEDWDRQVDSGFTWAGRWYSVEFGEPEGIS